MSLSFYFLIIETQISVYHSTLCFSMTGQPDIFSQSKLSFLILKRKDKKRMQIHKDQKVETLISFVSNFEPNLDCSNRALSVKFD